MDQKPPENNDALSIRTATSGSPPTPPAKNRRGAAHLIKVALYMIRRRSRKSNKSVDMASGGMWNRLVGSMRPLHHLHSHSSPNLLALKNELHDHDHDVIISSVQAAPMSPGASSITTSSSSDQDGMSRYASAANLQELDTESRYASAVNLRDLDHETDESESEDHHQTTSYDENGGDEMIDAKAEEFIAQFYEQIRLQRLNSMDRHYNEMIQRSIG
ncbi:cotton fiber protein [Parasponia andersonii]|uniref:Cotton fiber protein n=1 Tax=Parasponia andersonii TaxID=3476 RepID=A0A2P5CKU1_PARAD|nr:cotton fiber protein [Parasponia andersonii]